MTTAARDAMTAVENGWTIYNTTANAYQARINGSWVSLGAGGGGSAPINQALIDFGPLQKASEIFNVVDGSVSATSVINASLGWSVSTLRDADEIMADPITLVLEPLAGSFNVYAQAREGTVSGKYAINYQVG